MDDLNLGGSIYQAMYRLPIYCFNCTNQKRFIVCFSKTSRI